MYHRYTKVVEAEFPRMVMHATIPMGAPLAVVFDHYRLEKQLKSEFRKPVNLFFMAGTGMTKAVWKYHIKKLFEYSEQHVELPWQITNCVALDLVNHGDSAVENDGILGWEFDWREGSHDLIQVVKSLKLQGDSVVIGHSMGGFQSLYSTLISPLMFKFVIAIEPVTHGGDDQNSIFIKKMLPALDDAIQTRFTSEDQYYKYMKTMSFFRRFHPEVLNDFMEAEKVVNKDGTVQTKTSKEIQLICYHAGMRIFPIGLKLLSLIDSPVVLVVGEKATWTPKSNVREVNAVLKKGEFIEIPNGEHLVNGEDPDSIIDVIIKSLTKNIGTKGPQEAVVDRNTYDEIFSENYARLASEFFERKTKL
jgi:pimeloyl-ACP methyl ester carboxylesterase